jgi:hypothetical protein
MTRNVRHAPMKEIYVRCQRRESDSSEQQDMSDQGNLNRQEMVIGHVQFPVAEGPEKLLPVAFFSVSVLTRRCPER